MYKPGNVSTAPTVVAPHQPRLDWQMWFAALGHHTSSPWFTSFVHRLLQGKEDGERGWGPGALRCFGVSQRWLGVSPCCRGWRLTPYPCSGPAGAD